MALNSKSVLGLNGTKVNKDWEKEKSKYQNREHFREKEKYNNQRNRKKIVFPLIQDAFNLREL